jgi:hypothetical protein
MPWAEVFKNILAIQGGVHPALFLLCVMALAFAIWRLWQALQASEEARRKENAEWRALRETQFEQRLQETGLTRVALDHNTAGMATLVTSVEARTQPVQDMVHGLARLVSNNEMSRENFKEQANRIERLLEAVARGSQ